MRRRVAFRLIVSASLLVLMASPALACSGLGARRTIGISILIGLISGAISLGMIAVGTFALIHRALRRRVRWLVGMGELTAPPLNLSISPPPR